MENVRVGLFQFQRLIWFKIYSFDKFMKKY